MSGTVISMGGGPSGEKKVDPECVAALEGVLARARSGEVVGVAMVACLHDNQSSIEFGGYTGGWNMVGALEVLKSVFVADYLAELE